MGSARPRDGRLRDNRHAHVTGRGQAAAALPVPSGPTFESSLLAVRIPSLLAALVLAVAAPASFAAHPLQTEDTATQGVGNLEVENGLQRTHFASIPQTTYQPQLSLGLAATLDAIVQPAW